MAEFFHTQVWQNFDKISAKEIVSGLTQHMKATNKNLKETIENLNFKKDEEELR